VTATLFDTHAHIDFAQFDSDRELVLERAQTAGVRWLLNPGADLASSRRAVALAEAHAGVYAAVGIHPHDAGTATPAAIEELRRLARHPKVVAIGEIGLDYFRDLSPRTMQRAALHAQLELAVELQLPILVHDREAHTDVMAILNEYRGRLPAASGVLHAFSGDSEMATQVLDLGYDIAVGGPITFQNARRLPALLAHLPLERLLLETDCPYLAPHPYRGRRNEPAYLPLVAERLAQLLGLDVQRVTATTTDNALALFGLSGDS